MGAFKAVAPGEITPLLFHRVDGKREEKEEEAPALKDVKPPLAHWSSLLPAVALGFTSLAIVIPVLPHLKLQYFHGDYSLLTTWQSR
jgi:hypothetical protein